MSTDEISDIGRKLDKGVKLLEALPDIKDSVSMLPDIKTGIDMMNTKFDAFADGQRTFNQEMRVHNKLMDTHNIHLERIL